MHWSRETILGPLSRFMSLQSRDPVQVVLAYVTFFLSHLAAAAELKTPRLRSQVVSQSVVPSTCRVDAQASADRTRIGEWFPQFGPSVDIDTHSSQLFSTEIRQEDWPWVFEKSSKPSLIISTLEALAVPVALILYYEGAERDHRNSVRAPTITDNRGNGSVLNKLMSTKHHLRQNDYKFDLVQKKGFWCYFNPYCL